ncbi:hypothetical protein JTB14_027329 [Gonioctena quinquepunctata]|nr:hypothetical protein JTB14_027329 [Gonioctena quinquepunctata]
MQSATMSNNAFKRENTSASANVLMCKQWWKVCWMYGDQEKYYRQLYGKKSAENFGKVISDGKKSFADFQNFYENTGVVGEQRTETSPVNDSSSIEEIRLPSPSHGRNSSPGINSLEISRGLDE